MEDNSAIFEKHSQSIRTAMADNRSEEVKNHGEKAVAVAAKITSKAEDALSGLSLEMQLRKWPPDFQRIMWQAVAEIAARRADRAVAHSKTGREP